MAKKLKNVPVEPEHVTNNEEKLFSSYDIGLVAYLLCLKHELVTLNKAIKGKVLFILKRERNTDESVKNYWAFNSSVDAQTYFNQIKRLKNQIFSS